MSLNATDEQLDFPFVYCSAKDGYAKVELEHITGTMEPLFDMIVKYIPPPRAQAGEGFQVLVANLDYSRLPRAYRLRQDRRGQGEGGRGRLLSAWRWVRDSRQAHHDLPFRGAQTDRDRGSPRRGHRRFDRVRGRVHRRDPGRPAGAGSTALHPDRSAHHPDGVCRERRAAGRPGREAGHRPAHLGTPGQGNPDQCGLESGANLRSQGVHRQRSGRDADRHPGGTDAARGPRGAGFQARGALAERGGWSAPGADRTAVRGSASGLHGGRHGEPGFPQGGDQQHEPSRPARDH